LSTRFMIPIIKWSPKSRFLINRLLQGAFHLLIIKAPLRKHLCIDTRALSGVVLQDHELHSSCFSEPSYNSHPSRRGVLAYLNSLLNASINFLCLHFFDYQCYLIMILRPLQNPINSMVIEEELNYAFHRTTNF